jgi:hypothetical protein
MIEQRASPPADEKRGNAAVGGDGLKEQTVMYVQGMTPKDAADQIFKLIKEGWLVYTQSFCFSERSGILGIVILEREKVA